MTFGLTSAEKKVNFCAMRIKRGKAGSKRICPIKILIVDLHAIISKNQMICSIIMAEKNK
ncbi:MAG: hypothetical protein CRN43_21270 [Candidatus Nephrothrix sp. EaCA]|nr:MAG: hypothetical protein CRN43_21270 [Candidatus Nephrothrix sp. EaCA]